MFNKKNNLSVNNNNYSYFSINNFAEELNLDLKKVPFSLKILLENILRNCQEDALTKQNFTLRKNLSRL